MGKVVLIKFTDKKGNYKLMYEWCSNKYIYEWFEQRKLSYDEIEDKYKNKLFGENQDLFFIEYNNIKIGFVQIYKYDDDKKGKLTKYDNIYEYDIFIGEKDYLSKGIGSISIKYINNYIYNKYMADCIVLRPFKRNNRAIRCYQKNGFRIIDEYDDYDTVGNEEIIVLMIKEKED